MFKRLVSFYGLGQIRHLRNQKRAFSQGNPPISEGLAQKPFASMLILAIWWKFAHFSHGRRFEFVGESINSGGGGCPFLPNGKLTRLQSSTRLNREGIRWGRAQGRAGGAPRP